MNYKTIQVGYEGKVATLTLNRPDKRNAISFELIDDLLRALEEIANSDAIVLIVTGAGKAFCSGMDLDNLKALLGRTPNRTSRIPKPWWGCSARSTSFPRSQLRP
jgi:enoyl-CoA hydratase/carnithine racemase